MITLDRVNKAIDYYVKLGITAYGIQGMYYANKRHLIEIGKDLLRNKDWA